MAKQPVIDPAADAAVIEAMSSGQLGANPNAPPPAAAPPPAPPKAPTGDTANDAVQTHTAPDTEAKQSAQAPVSYKVDVDGQIREFTPEQIANTTKRYADLNYKHQTEYAPIAPAIDVLNKIYAQAKADGVQLDGQTLAAFLTDSLLSAANSHNTQLGAAAFPNGNPPTAPGRTDAAIPQPHGLQDPNDFEAQLAQWEADNAVTLPPAYKNMASQLSGSQAQMQQMQQMLQQMQSQMQGVTQNAQGQLQQGQQAQSAAYLKSVANNLQIAQQKHGLRDDQEADFMMFAGERGYSVEDFIDPGLTNKVVQDFAAVQNTPEMERLREINQRRQAFTGTLTAGAPGAQGAITQGPSQDEQLINSMTDATLKSRNLL